MDNSKDLVEALHLVDHRTTSCRRSTSSRCTYIDALHLLQNFLQDVELPQHSSLFWPFPFRPYFFRQISNQIFKIFHTCITFDIQTPILYIFFMKIYWVVFFKETFFHFHLQKNLSLMKWNSLFNPRIREHYLWNDSEWSITTFPTFKSLRKDLNKDKNQNQFLSFIA